jgi:hypothetical protein
MLMPYKQGCSSWCGSNQSLHLHCRSHSCTHRMASGKQWERVSWCGAPVKAWTRCKFSAAALSCTGLVQLQLTRVLHQWPHHWAVSRRVRPHMQPWLHTRTDRSAVFSRDASGIPLRGTGHACQGRPDCASHDRCHPSDTTIAAGRLWHSGLHQLTDASHLCPEIVQINSSTLDEAWQEESGGHRI